MTTDSKDNSKRLKFFKSRQEKSNDFHPPQTKQEWEDYLLTLEHYEKNAPQGDCVTAADGSRK